MLRKFHLWAGLAGVVGFMLTGQYMHWVHDHLYGMADGPRLIYRSAHIYMLLCALVNLAFGCYQLPAASRLSRALQVSGSIAVLSAPVFLCWSFFFETYNIELARPIARIGIHGVFVGTLLHAVAAAREGLNNRCPPGGGGDAWTSER